MPQINVIGGPGTALSWSVAGVAPALALSNAAFVFTAMQYVGDVEQVGLMVEVINSAGAPTANMRIQWSPNDVAGQVYEEQVEEQGLLLVGPPASRQFTCNIKEWGPLPGGVGGAGTRRYAIPRPAIYPWISVGILWSAAPAGVDAVNLWLTRQIGAQLQGPQS